MMIKKIISVSMAFMMTFSLAACSGPIRGERSRTDRALSDKFPDVSVSDEQSDVMFQVSLLQGLTFGDYNGSITVEELKEHGDTGLGTFDALNGEMIVIDGEVYRAAGDGTVEEVPDTETVPFSNVTFLDSDMEMDIRRIGDIGSLLDILNETVEERGINRFYMVRIDGRFSEINVRSELAQEEPYKPLATVLETDQTFFDYENVDGTLVCLYCPPYMKDLNATGWHLHFISDDRTMGGHVLGLKLTQGTITWDDTDGFEMQIPDNEMFAGFDLTIDQSEDIERVENADAGSGDDDEEDNDDQADPESEDTDDADQEDIIRSISYEGYTLEQVIVLSRHNIRSPLSGAGSVLGSITPYDWFEWTSAPSELSLRGGVLETEMGHYFRKWMEEEGLITAGYDPAPGEFRIYANSKQRTIATAQYFASALLPTAGLEVEYHAEFDKMDPVFTPQLTFCTDEYAADAKDQILDMFEDRIAGLEDNYELLSEVIGLTDSESYKNGDITGFVTDDSIFSLVTGAEPAVSGSLKTACSVSDALTLQYYEESDAVKAAFGNELTMEEWEQIAEIKDVYGDVLFTAPLVAINVANPLLEEIDYEMGMSNRKFTFLCGHDSNIGSVLAALGAEDYDLEGAIEKTTPIGCKLVFTKWSNESGDQFWSADLVYQTTEQLRNAILLDLNNPPAICHLSFDGIRQNNDGLYKDEDFRGLFEDAIGEYYRLYTEYVVKAA